MFILYDSTNDQTWGPFTSERKAKAWCEGMILAAGDVRSLDDLDEYDLPMGMVVSEVECVDEDDDVFVPFRTEGSHTYHKTFGPGRLESIEVYKWSNGGATRVVGTYTVYCGMGNEHTVEIDEWLGLRERNEMGLDWSDDDSIVDCLIEHYLSDNWSDPCDIPMEPCPACEDGVITPDNESALDWTCHSCGYKQHDDLPAEDN